MQIETGERTIKTWQEQGRKVTETPLEIGNRIRQWNIDALKDIVANKMQALMNRLEPKDFVDIYFIAQEKNISFQEMHELFYFKFGLKIDPITLGSECAKVRSLKDLPRMIKPLTIEELKAFFSAKAKELQSTIIET